MTGEAVGAETEPRLLLRFVNTRPIVDPVDRLSDAASARSWLAENGLIDNNTLVTEADAAAARELRTALLALLKSHVGIDESAEMTLADRILQRAAATYPLAARIGNHRSRLVSLQTGVAGALGAVLAETAAVAADERQWSRLKACKNPACYKAFHDTSRNASALYCAHTCASQVSMRVFRQRQQASAADSGARHSSPR